MVAEPEGPDAFDRMDPGNVSPLVAYLASAGCTATGDVFAVSGGRVERLVGWSSGERLLDLDRRPTVAEVAAGFGAA
jgi:hypothetical protein